MPTRDMKNWETAIAKVVSDGETEEIIVRGHRMADLIGNITFAEAMFLMLQGRLPTKPQARVLDALLVASIEHGYVMSDEALALAREQGVVLVGTETPGMFMERFGRSEHDARTIDRLRRAHRAGAKVAFGTDIIRAPAGMSRGAVTMSVIDAWVEAGIPAADILRAMTADAADLLGMAGERGQIRTGYYADLVATPVSPLADISTLKQVTFVMKHGVVMKEPAPARPR